MTFTPWLTALVISTFQPNGLPTNAIVRLGVSPLRLGPVQVAVSSDSTRIRTVTQDGFVRIFDANKGELLASRQLMQKRDDNNNNYGGNQGLAGLSADGSVALIQDSSDYSSRGIRLFETETGKVRLKYPQVPGNDWIAGATVSPDGKKVLVNEYGNGNPRYTVVDVATGTSRNLIEPQNNAGVVIAANMMHFSPDSTKVILLDPNGAGAAGTNGTCYVVEDGKKLWTEPVGWNPRFTYDSKQIVSVGGGLAPNRVLDATTGKEVKTKMPKPGEVFQSHVMGPKGDVLFPLKKGGATLWNLAKGESISTLPTGLSSQGAGQAAFAPDNSFLITAFHGNLCRWNLPKGDRVFGEPAPPGTATIVSRVIFSPDGQKLFSLGEGDSHGTWDVAKRTWLPTPSRGQSDKPNDLETLMMYGAVTPRSVAYTAAGPRFIAGGYGSPLEVFDGSSGKRVAKLQEDKKKDVQQFDYASGMLTSDGATALISRMNYTGNESRITVEKWDVATGSRQHKIELSAGNYTPYASLSPCGRFAFLGSKVIVLSSGAVHFSVNKNDQQQYYYYGGTSFFSPDGRVLATTITDTQRDYNQQFNDLYLWDVASGTPIRKLTYRVAGAAFSPDSRLIAIVNTKGIKVFDCQTGDALLTAPVTDMRMMMYYDGTNGATSVAFSPDNSTLATGHNDGTVTLWKIPSLKKQDELKADAYEKFWNELATQDPIPTRAMAQRLLDHPASAIPFLQAKFLAPPLPPLDVDPNTLVRKLDSPAYSDRYAAYRKLKEYGPRVAAVLEDNLRKTESVEVRAKIEELLNSQNTGPKIAGKGADLRALRMMEVLERLGTAEAKQLLQSWTEHTSNMRLAAEARLALSRIAARGK